MGAGGRPRLHSTRGGVAAGRCSDNRAARRADGQQTRTAAGAHRTSTSMRDRNAIQRFYRYLVRTSVGRYLSTIHRGFLGPGPDLYRFALGQAASFVDPLGLRTVYGALRSERLELRKKLTGVSSRGQEAPVAIFSRQRVLKPSLRRIRHDRESSVCGATSQDYGEWGDGLRAAALSSWTSDRAQAGQIISGADPSGYSPS